MPESVIDICRRGYDDYDEGRLEDVYAALDPEISFDHLGAFLDPQPIRGLADYKRFVGQIEDTYEVFQIGNREYFEIEPEKVLLTAKLRTVRRGTKEDKSQDIAWLWTFRDGRFLRGHEYLNANQARQAHSIA